jgi:hypothetical protein
VESGRAAGECHWRRSLRLDHGRSHGGVVRELVVPPLCASDGYRLVLPVASLVSNGSRADAPHDVGGATKCEASHVPPSPFRQTPSPSSFFGEKRRDGARPNRGARRGERGRARQGALFRSALKRSVSPGTGFGGLLRDGVDGMFEDVAVPLDHGPGWP